MADLPISGLPDLPVPLDGDVLAVEDTTNNVTKKATVANLREALASPLDAVYGDGRDGDVVISTPTTLTRDMYYNNLTVSSTLTTNGWKIHVKNTLDGDGTIKWGVPNNGDPGTDGFSGGAQGGAGGAQSGAGLFKNNNGGNGSGSGLATPIAFTHCVGVAGGRGGKGGNTADGYSATCTISSTMILTLLGINAVLGYDVTNGVWFPFSCSGGGAGGNGSGHSTWDAGGGGGGASGGLVWIAVKIWTGTFTIESKGGNGGAAPAHSGYSGGGGGGGGGGVALIIYRTKTWTGSYLLTGGIGGVSAKAQSGENGPTGLYYELHPSDIL